MESEESVPDKAVPEQRDGITSGPGNQGTALSPPHGQSGTGAGFSSLPRQIKQGAWGSKPL